VTRPTPDRKADPTVPSRTARRRRPGALALVAIALSLTGGAYALATAAASPVQAETSEASPELIAQGKQLYLEGCSSCHGLNLEGVSADDLDPNDDSSRANGPSLIGVGAAAVDFQVSTGRMPLAAGGTQAQRNRPSYTPEEIEALAAYVASFAPGPANPSEADLDLADADLAEGAELFLANCAQCHQAQGAGGALTNGKYAPTLRGVEPRTIYQAMLTGPQNMPIFGDGTLTPEEKRHVIAYIQALEEQPSVGGAPLGRVGPVSEGLFIWTIGLGALIAAAVWLGAKAK
jgi:ubiquinol-cytochrome c reductase cytochrome c subunit